MDLRRLKTVFIVLLLVVNAMLAYIVFSAKNYEQEERRIIEANLLEVLAKDKIYISEELTIPESPKVDSFYLEKMFGSHEDMAKKLLGTDYRKGENGVFQNAGGTLRVFGDEFNFRRTASGNIVSDFSSENVEKLCRNEMTKLGILQEIYAFGGVNKISGGVKAIFTVKMEEIEFFDAYISFEVSGKGITGISGKNVISNLNMSGGTAVYFSATSILTDMTKSDTLPANTAHTVVSIKPGYYIGKSEENFRNILAIPVWQIVTDTNIVLYYDARNGQEITENK